MKAMLDTNIYEYLKDRCKDNEYLEAIDKSLYFKDIIDKVNKDGEINLNDVLNCDDKELCETCIEGINDAVDHAQLYLNELSKDYDDTDEFETIHLLCTLFVKGVITPNELQSQLPTWDLVNIEVPEEIKSLYLPWKYLDEDQLIPYYKYAEELELDFNTYVRICNLYYDIEEEGMERIEEIMKNCVNVVS